MDAEPIYYLTLSDGEPKECDCRIGGFTVINLPVAIPDRRRKLLSGGGRWKKRLLRFLCLRKTVRGKGTVVVSDGVRALFPGELYYKNMTDRFPSRLYAAYAAMELENLTAACRENRRGINLLAVLPEEGAEPDFLLPILEAAQEMESVYFWTGDDNEKEWIEDRLDFLMEESGVAGMCYVGGETFANPFWIGAERVKKQEEVILMDFSDQPPAKLWGLDDYIDGAGKKNGKEIKILTGRKTGVKALRNYLDRVFCATVY